MNYAHYRQSINSIMQAAFGMDVQAHRRYKGLPRVNQRLRDHMGDLELTLLTARVRTLVQPMYKRPVRSSCMRDLRSNVPRKRLHNRRKSSVTLENV